MSLEVLGRTSAQMAKTTQNKTDATAKEKSAAKDSGASYANADEYAAALRDKYSYFGRTTKVANVPTTVNVSPAYLRKCASDPEKQAEMEKSLDSIASFMPTAVQRTRMMPGNPVMTHYDCTIDANGNMTVISGCTNDPKVKNEWERVEKRGKKEKTEEEKLAERRAKKRAEERKREETQAEAEIVYRASGRDVAQINDSLLRQMANRGEGKKLVSRFDALA